MTTQTDDTRRVLDLLQEGKITVDDVIGRLQKREGDV